MAMTKQEDKCYLIYLYVGLGTEEGFNFFLYVTVLYEFLFDDRFDNAHDANADVGATAKCFFELVKRT